MKATIDVATLKDASAWASKRAAVRPARPEFSGVLLGVHTEDAFTLDATDLTASGSATVRCDTVDPGEALVHAVTLAKIAAQLPGEVAKMMVEGDRLRITSGTARFSLRCMAREDFPALPRADRDPDLVDGDTLAQILRATAPAAGQDDKSRVILTGVYLSAAKGRLTAAATDSYRLHVASMAWPGEDAAAVVPADVARSVARDCIADKAEVALDKARVLFGMGSRQIVTNAIEGTFPDFRQLIPTTREHRVVVSGPDLAQVVKRCATVAEEQTGGGAQLTVRIGDGEVAVTADDRGSDGFDSVEAETDTADLTMSCNSKYLGEAIAAVAPDGGDITVDLRDELKPFVLRAEGFDGPDDPLALVMPIRI